MVQMNLFPRQEQRCRHRERTCGHSGERRGTRWETRHTDIHRLAGVGYTASAAAAEKPLCGSGSSAQC